MSDGNYKKRSLSSNAWTTTIVQPIQRLLIVCLPCIVVCFVRATASQDVTCPDENDDEPMPFLKTVLLSEVIFFSRVLRTYEDARYRRGVYTAEMEVYCIIKGNRTDRFVNITEAGMLPGKCFSTSLTPGSNYVLLAEFDGSRYRPLDTEKPGTQTTLNEVASVCHLDPKYPIDVTERTAMLRCPTPSPPGECIDFNHFATTTTTIEPVPTEDDYDYPPDGPVIVEPDLNGEDYEQHRSSSKSPVLFVRLLPILVLLSTLYKILAACLGY